jgi:hypothetical protein
VLKAMFNTLIIARYFMKKTLIILTAFMFLSCHQKKQNVKQGFTEKDAYEVINKHLSNLLHKYDLVIYVNTRQLSKLDINHTKVFPYPDRPAPYPVFSKNYWIKKNIKGVKFIEWEEYNSFFTKGYSKDLEKLWETKFNNRYVQNLSYPIYNSKKKIAVLRDYSYQPFLTCGTGLNNIYYYKKTKNGWEQINSVY